jgi:hypothetical protein
MGWVIVGLMLGSSGMVRDPYEFILYYNDVGDYLSEPTSPTSEDVELAGQISSKGRALFAFVCFTV